MSATPDSPRVLLLLSTASYRARAFLDAARRLGVNATVGSDRRQALADFHPEGHLTLPLPDASRAIPEIRAFARAHPLRAVIAADDDGAELAAMAAEALGLAAHPPEAVRAARHKRLTRERLTAAGMRQPRFAWGGPGDDPRRVAGGLGFPVVAKPVRLAASQGVMRADDPGALLGAWARIGALLRNLHPGAGPGDPACEMVVEEFVPGAEVALEGILTRGELRTLAIFEKPDPLDGPCFEETIYLTPPRLAAGAAEAVVSEVRRACAALGLAHGPVHAEVRLAPGGPVVLEIAPRSIGGLCSRALRFGAGDSLEMLLLRHALGEDVGGIEREPVAAGVMMIPIPGSGVLKSVYGQDSARSVPGVEDIRIMVAPGAELVPLPEGGRYLGFIFARGGDSGRVEQALRKAHRLLTFDIVPNAADLQGVSG